MSSRLTFLTNYQTSVIQFNTRNFISFAKGISVHHYQCGKTFCVKTGKWLLFFTKKKKNHSHWSSMEWQKALATFWIPAFLSVTCTEYKTHRW